MSGRVAFTAKPRSVLGMAIAAVIYGGFSARQAHADAMDAVLQEIVVTARKRAENLQDVPQNIDVYTPQDLRNLGIVKLEDYVALTPSMSMISIGPGRQRFFLRGASDGSNPNYGFGNISTTGFLVDDLSFSFRGNTPDLHLYDVERIEVLNGPQGTLFGPGAMSGAVRIITNKPDPNAFSAAVDVDESQINHGANNWSYEGYANIPLIEGRTALRLSGYAVRQGGYIDNVLATRNWANGVTSTNAEWAGRNQNTRDILGGRIALLHDLSDGWRVTLAAFYQQQRYRGSFEDDPTNVGPRELRRFSPQGGYDYGRFVELHLEGDVGIGDLIYSGGYSSQPLLHLYDFSEYAQYSGSANFIQSFACATDPAGGPGGHSCNVPYMYATPGADIERWSNELRLQSKSGGRTHWTVGAYWEKTRNPYDGFIRMPNINFKGAPAQSLISYYGNVATPLPEEFYSNFATGRVLQESEFGDITVDLTDRFSVEGGVEHFHSSTSDSTDWYGMFWNAKTPSYWSSTADKTNFKAGVTFKPDSHTMLYATFAQGFRDGSFNYLSPNFSDPTIPRDFKPDTLNNYELGWKAERLNGRLIWNAAAYYMQWKNYQIAVSVPRPPFGFNANVGDVRIAGFESTLELRSAEGWQLTLNANYNDSRLRSDTFQNPVFLVVPGERLPEAPSLNWSAVVRYEAAVSAGARAFAQFDVAHKGNMWNDLRLDVRVLQPAYSLSNLRFGLTQPDGHWRAEAYITNLTNKRAVVFANVTGYANYQAASNPEIATAPRVFGLRLGYSWGKSR